MLLLVVDVVVVVRVGGVVAVVGGDIVVGFCFVFVVRCILRLLVVVGEGQRTVY